MINANEIKIVFFGTPDFAAVILKSLIENKFDIAAVFTQPDKKSGRHQKIVYSPVKDLALRKKIKIFQPESLRDGYVFEETKNIKPDLFVVAAYGKILPKNILDIPKFGAVNVHGSLLPKYRGASPVQCAILTGEKETGITLMKMNEKMDEGDILAQKKMGIEKNDTTGTLMDKLADLGAETVAKFIPIWIDRKIDPIRQDHEKATYCKSVKRENGKIDWNSSAKEVYRLWRAYQPWPGVYSVLNVKNKPKRLKLLEIEVVLEKKTGEKIGKIIEYNQKVAVQAKNGLVFLKKIQLEGKKEMDIDEFLRGNTGFVGSTLK